MYVYFIFILVGHGSGIPSTGLRRACLCVCCPFVCHENCLLWTIPSIPSISFFLSFFSLLLFGIRAVLCDFPPFRSQSERFWVLFPLFVHNPSAFRREAPSKPSKAPHRVPRHPRPTPTCAAAYAPTPSPKGTPGLREAGGRARSWRAWFHGSPLAGYGYEAARGGLH